MATQHDYIIDNASGAGVRADLNNALAAIAKANEGAAAPPTTYPFMPWMDTTNNLLKRRDAANLNWVTIASLSGTTWIPYRSGVALGDAATKTIGIGAGQVPLVDNALMQGLHQINIAAESLRPMPTSPSAGALAEAETTTNGVPFKYRPFDPTVAESLYAVIAMPKSWDNGDLQFAYEWSHAAATAFGVALGMKCLARSDDDALDGAAFGAEVILTDIGGTTDDLYKTGFSANVTPGGTPAENDTLHIIFTRKVADAGDTLNVDMRLGDIKLLYNVDRGNDA